MPSQPRTLKDLISIGPAMLRDFEVLGIRSVQQLATKNPKRMYEKLCRGSARHLLSGRICLRDSTSERSAAVR
ncbi:MAG: hypothetical protein JWO13_3257 [Acidobacteriales bacterium]|nr:hypothetical protein [Terriglobales bacterium]